MWSKLIVTDGTKAGTVDILAYLKEWLPQMAPTKDGGSWSGSSYTQGRQLFAKQLENIINTFTLSPVTGSQTGFKAYIDRLTPLLDKGVSYWLNDFSTGMVWVEMRPRKQDESQYALICNWDIPQMDEYFAAPFSANGTMEDLSLIIEHGIWLENEPGEGTAIELQSANTDVSANTDRKRTWVSNYWDGSPISHVFVYDAAPAGWTNITGVTGVNLFPAVPAVGDILYVGVENTGTESPFHNMVFNIGVAQAGLTIATEYSLGGAAWGALPAGAFPYHDDTNDFLRTGPNVIVLDYVGGINPWLPDVINGVTAWWIRFRITGAVAPTTPTIVSDPIYTNEWPYFDIPADQVSGTYPAQARYELWRRDESEDEALTYVMIGTKVLLGLRSLDRGEDFLAFLPTQDPILPADVAYTANLGAMQLAVNTPWFYGHQWIPGGAVTDAAVGYWTISDPSSRQYSGSYRMFLRVKDSSPNVGDIYMKLTLAVGNIANVVFTSSPKQVVSLGEQVVLDFGPLNIPEAYWDESYDYDLFFMILGTATATATNIYFYDLILIPVDECAIDLEVSANNNFQTFDTDEILRPDSISVPKFNITAPLLREDITGGSKQFVLDWQARTPGENFLQINQENGQRVWVLILYNKNYVTGGEPDYWAIWSTAVSVLGWRNQRYKVLKG